MLSGEAGSTRDMSQRGAGFSGVCVELSHVPQHETHLTSSSRTARGEFPSSLYFPLVLANPQVPFKRAATAVCQCLSPTVESVMYDVSHCPHVDKLEHFPIPHALSCYCLTPRKEVPGPKGAAESSGRGLATGLHPLEGSHPQCRCLGWWMPPPPPCWRLCQGCQKRDGCPLGTWEVNIDSGVARMSPRRCHRFLTPLGPRPCPPSRGMLGGSGHPQVKGSPDPQKPGTRGLRHSSRHSQPRRRMEA